ncbi:hypothetical protein FRX31_028014 [Thalictrum thalictroides]|uniref:Uncharacterized protein n=1 Tax=Thalictrum thalictroides TaxID=46969 RepID=A0A7J6VCC1_THATH|nr:hypothetical protein FRX31_028014 [Thalictrum thalictroides]
MKPKYHLAESIQQGFLEAEVDLYRYVPLLYTHLSFWVDPLLVQSTLQYLKPRPPFLPLWYLGAQATILESTPVREFYQTLLFPA